eukprot:TRINITY_DN3846_c0_g2_i1.p1 TRINITY_DN3846_c0_g2~~TRINITY_DN3846_c0_g2_i1.p1  ORF type:complete len:101 (-),score=14.55 TRINITY_DN3846_c0_g2_i1:183-485(-)
MKRQSIYKKSSEIRCRLLYRCINALIWKQESFAFNAILRIALKGTSTRKSSAHLKLAALLHFSHTSLDSAFHYWLGYSRRAKQVRLKCVIALAKVSALDM